MPKRINYIAPFTWKSRSSPLPKGAGPCLLGDYWVRFAGFEKPLNSLILMVPLPRLERGTPRSTIWCSNQLSYSGVARGAVNSVLLQTSSAQMQARKAKIFANAERYRNRDAALHFGEDCVERLKIAPSSSRRCNNKSTDAYLEFQLGLS